MPITTTVSKGFTSGAQTSLTFSHTSDRRPLYVCLSWFVAAGGTESASIVTGVTFDGDSLERGGHTAVAGQTMEWWRLMAPPDDNPGANVVIALSGARRVTAAALNLSDWPALMRDHQFAAAGGLNSVTTPAVTVNSQTGAEVLDWLGFNQPTQVSTPGGGQTEKWSQDGLGGGVGDAGDQVSAGSLKTSAGTTAATSWTLTVDEYWGLAALSYRPPTTSTVGGEVFPILRRSINIHDELNETPNTATFTARAQADGTIPVQGQEVELVDHVDGTVPVVVFRGYILKVERIAAGHSPFAAIDDPIPLYHCACVDYTWEFDWHRLDVLDFVPGVPVSATDIVNGIAYAKAPQFSRNHVEAGLPDIEGFVAEPGALLSATLTQIAKIVKAKWYIDYDKDLHFFVTAETENIPADLDASNNTFWDFRYHNDISQIRTRVRVYGWTTGLTADAPSSSTDIQVADTTPFNDGGGMAIVRNSQFSYTSRSTTEGPGSLIGIPVVVPGVVEGIVTDCYAGDVVQVLAIREDATAAGDLGDIVGGGDVYIEHTIVDTTLDDKNAHALAQADLDQNKTPEPQITFSSRDPNMTSGKPIVVNVTDAETGEVITGTFQIQSVDVSDDLAINNNVLPYWFTRQVRAGRTKVDFFGLFGDRRDRGGAGIGTGGGGGGGATIEAATVSTNESTSSTSYTDLSTVGPSVTLSTGSWAILWISATSVKTTVSQSAWISVAVSGATTIAAADVNAAKISSYSTEAAGNAHNHSRGLQITGLTPGVNTFTLKYRVDGSTFAFVNRSIVVLGGGATSINLGGGNEVTTVSTLTNHTLVVGDGAAGITSIGSGTAGQILTSAGSSADPVFTNIGVPTLIRKTSDESLNTNTTLQADDALLFAVGASETWIFEFHVYYLGNTTGDFKCGLKFPTTPTEISYDIVGPAIGAATDASSVVAGDYSSLHAIADAVGGMPLGADTVQSVVVLRGYIRNSTNAGNAGVYWTQATSNPTNTTVKAGSWGLATRLA